MAARRYPGRYQSDFAVQVTSRVADAQQFTKHFSNNNLMGSANFDPYYKSSKARVCVTVGMMTTGYDCPDLLNLALMRPIFSVTDFVQIKGRGTRKHDFRDEYPPTPAHLRAGVADPIKTRYKLFDYFANCEYFQTGFDYDEALKLPVEHDDPAKPQPPGAGAYTHAGEDVIVSIAEQTFPGGMKADRHFFGTFADKVRADQSLAQAVEAGRWDEVLDRVKNEFLGKPSEFYTLEKLRAAAGVDRRLSLREILEYVFHLIPRLKQKDELLEEEFNKFVADRTPADPLAVPAIRQFFKAYATSDQLRHIIDAQGLCPALHQPRLHRRRLHGRPGRLPHDRSRVHQGTYVSLNQFMG